MPEVPAKGNLCKCVKARYVLAVLGGLGMAIVYGLKVNISVAMVGMLNHTAIAHSKVNNSGLSNITARSAPTGNECQESANSATKSQEDGPFTWSEPLQGAILSSYFWGYMVAQLPGGRTAEVLSAKWVMFFSVAINVVCTILTPPMANWHPAAMIVMRVGEGIGGGVTFPAMHVMLAHWAPPAERSTIAAIVYAGTSLGTVISMLTAGVLASYWGWESVFYVMGGVCAIWCIFWVWLVKDSPETQKLITMEERQYIMDSLGKTTGQDIEKKRLPVPWKAVFSSVPFWAILVAHTCSNWGWYMVLIELPFYMKQILKFKMSENALLTSLPFFTMWIFSLILSKVLDVLRAKNKLSTTWARKVSTLIASVIPAIMLIGLCYVGCIKWLAVTMMTVAVTGVGGMFTGFLSNHIDIAPNFAGTLIALTNTVATIPGIVVPLFVGWLTEGNQTIKSWRIIFYSTVGTYIVEIIAFTAFGTGVQQPWNNVGETKKQEQIPIKPEREPPE